MEQTNKSIYARMNSDGMVTIFFSDVFEKPLSDDVLIESGSEDYHAHVHLKYKAIDEKGLHNFKVVNGVLTGRSAEEKAIEERERPKPPLTLEEKVAGLEIVTTTLDESNILLFEENQALKNSQAEQDEAIISLYEMGAK